LQKLLQNFSSTFFSWSAVYKLVNGNSLIRVFPNMRSYLTHWTALVARSWYENSEMIIQLDRNLDVNK